VRRRDDRPVMGWVLLLLCLTLAIAGDIAADTGSGDPNATTGNAGGGSEPDTLYGGPGQGGNHSGDPDDLDFVSPPVWIWINCLLQGMGR